MIGFVYQSFNLIPDLSVSDNIALPMSIAGIPSLERRKRVNELAERVGIGPRLQHRPWQLSGGQQQRVAIARALAMSPSLLLCDEPTGNLDSATGAAMWDLLREQNRRGATLIVVTHNREFVTRGTRTLAMADGRITNDRPAERWSIGGATDMPTSTPPLEAAIAVGSAVV
jgi:putative ABC transport system ATP-binding protein